MANPYPLELRERAVRAYESGKGTYSEVAEHFMIHRATLIRWVQRARETGTVAATDRGGGWVSPVDVSLLQRLVTERPDRTTDELTREYNRWAMPERRVHRSSVLRALQRSGYVFKKNGPGRRNKIVRMSKPSAGASDGGRKR
jgi:transposase